MNQPPFDLPLAHRWFAVELNNRAWHLYERSDRSPADDDEMLRTAQAALYHWSQVGTEVNLLRGEVLLTHASAAVGRAEPALYHATRAQQHAGALSEVEPFDAATVETGLAQAYRLAGDRANERAAITRALTIAETLGDDDRQVFDRLCPLQEPISSLLDFLGSVPKADELEFTRDRSLVRLVDL